MDAEIYYIIQWIELIASIPLLFTGVLFVCERTKKSLVPIGFLLLAIGTDLSTGHLFLITKCISENTVDNQLLLPKNTFISLLSIGVGVNILFWSIVVCIFEFKARMILAKKKAQK